MKRKSTLSAIGGYQPFLFCAGMYFVALFFSIFICSAIFHAANPKKSMGARSTVISQQAGTGSGHQVLLTVAN
ncbi:MAG: hypothetical protein P0Y53_25245 [Candidatus Pseudobacter hemicellulosilyticus]|uniref:Uncharacterized protein n=1 Tax=Candidatus Pseudobacter hemicellulosilyticus TaxID=3121375 RepID=A0AAJ5WRR8_9BACT|nr:MAG: hypothetical protein P0Y53_25245 [Pseudobacter sp.]